MAVMVFIAMIMMMMMMMMMMTTAIHSVLLKEDASLSNHFSGTQFFRLRHFVRGVNISDFSTEVHTTNFADGQYLSHARNHFTRAMAAMDSCFVLVKN